MRVDFPVSGENVRKADKRGPEVDFAKQKTEGEKKAFSPPVSYADSPLIRGGLVISEC